MRRWFVLGGCLEAVAIACLAVAYSDRKIEAASYTPLSPEPTNWFSPFSWSDPYLWLGGGVAFAVVGALVLLVARRA